MYVSEAATRRLRCERKHSHQITQIVCDARVALTTETEKALQNHCCGNDNSFCTCPLQSHLCSFHSLSRTTRRLRVLAIFSPVLFFRTTPLRTIFAKSLLSRCCRRVWQSFITSRFFPRFGCTNNLRSTLARDSKTHRAKEVRWVITRPMASHSCAMSTEKPENDRHSKTAERHAQNVHSVL